jgi:hypothetical protein
MDKKIPYTHNNKKTKTKKNIQKNIREQVHFINHREYREKVSADYVDECRLFF